MRLLTMSTALAGLLLGAGLDLATIWMTISGPTGERWSFRGNGALVVPLGLGAAVLAGGWATLSLYARGVRAWLGFGVAVGAAAAIPAVLSVVVLVLFGDAAQSVSDLLTIPAFAGPGFSLALALALQLRPGGARRLLPVHTLLTGVVFAIALAVGFMAADSALSPRPA